MTRDELITFEEEIKEAFLAKKILSPVHLSRGNEEPLIEIFKGISPQDWVLSTHRSHYHALLKGISPDWLKAEILAGRSMHIMNREHNFFSSAIVGGNLPIAVGIALAIKMKRENRQVYCFVGDMAAETGAFQEAVKYSEGHELPVTFVIEDNGLSTNTPTAEVWGSGIVLIAESLKKICTIRDWGQGQLWRYRYTRVFPHVGCGTFVHF